MKDIRIFGLRNLVNGPLSEMDRIALQEWADVEIKSSAWMCYVRDAIRQQNRDALIVQYPGTSPAVQWLRLRTSTAGGTGSIPDRGTKIPHASWCGQKKKNIVQYPYSKSIQH